MNKFLFWPVCIALSVFCLWWSLALVHKTRSENAVRKYILQAREDVALAKEEDKSRDILIGVALSQLDVDKNSQGTLHGIEIAADQINAAGGILGHQVGLVVKDDGRDVKEAMKVAQELATNPDLTAVIGHRYSSICDSVCVMYEYYGMPNISPTATAGLLTEKGFQYNAQACLSDGFYAGKIADFLKKKEFDKVVIFNVLDVFGKGYRNALETIKDEHSYTIEAGVGFANSTSAEKIKKNLKWISFNFDYDAIILIGYTEQITQHISSIRKFGIDKPIITIESLDANAIKSIVEDIDNTYIISGYIQDTNNPLYDQLYESYTRQYEDRVTSYVVNGFNALYILKLAIESADTLQPEIFSQALRSLKGVDANGAFEYQPNGGKRSNVAVKYVTEGGKISLVDYL